MGEAADDEREIGAGVVALFGDFPVAIDVGSIEDVVGDDVGAKVALCSE